MALLVFTTLLGPAVPLTAPATGSTRPHRRAVDPGGGAAAVRVRPGTAPLGA